MDTSYNEPPGIVSLHEVIQNYNKLEDTAYLISIISSYHVKEIELVPVGTFAKTYYNRIDIPDYTCSKFDN